MRRKLMLMVALLFAVGTVLVGCGGESTIEPVENDSSKQTEEAGDNETTEGANEETNDEANEADNKEPKVFGVGETVNFDGLHITVNDAYITKGNPDEFTEAMNDYYVVVDVTIENTTDQSAAVSSLMQISLLDADGYSQDIGIGLNTKGSLDGEIGAGRKLSGEVAFDVHDSEYFEFIFEDPFTTGQAIWKLDKANLEEK